MPANIILPELILICRAIPLLSLPESQVPVNRLWLLIPYIKKGRGAILIPCLPYARQFMGRIERPHVDHIEGLSPALSIDQKTAGRNPRSAVGTITEIYDFLRLLFARAGTP